MSSKRKTWSAPQGVLIDNHRNGYTTYQAADHLNRLEGELAEAIARAEAAEARAEAMMLERNIARKERDEFRDEANETICSLENELSSQTYQGNSIGYIYDKMICYGKQLYNLKVRAEAAEAKLAAVIAMLEPDGPPIPGGMFDKENRFYYRYGKALHARAVALAEGRVCPTCHQNYGEIGNCGCTDAAMDAAEGRTDE